MKHFTEYNTEGYTQNELDAFNAEWEEKAEKRELEPGTEEYEFQLKCFQDEVAKR